MHVTGYFITGNDKFVEIPSADDVVAENSHILDYGSVICGTERLDAAFEAEVKAFEDYFKGAVKCTKSEYHSHEYELEFDKFKLDNLFTSKYSEFKETLENLEDVSLSEFACDDEGNVRRMLNSLNRLYNCDDFYVVDEGVELLTSAEFIRYVYSRPSGTKFYLKLVYDFHV